MSLNLDLEKNILQNSKVPKWLRPTGTLPTGRPELPIDQVEENGTALDTAHGRPSLRFRTYKKVKRRLAEMEELHEWIEKKGVKETTTGETHVDDFLDGLEKSLNSMI